LRTIGVVTVGRSDYGIYLPVLRMIAAAPDLSLLLIASGSHLSPEFGHTVDSIRHDGFIVSDRIEMLLSSDTPEGIAKSMGLGLLGFAQSYARLRPDMLLVLGDRFEMHSAALAALPFKIPVAHIHGGERTEGAIDESLRHSMTKLSHLHFVATEEYARRVEQLGEERWRITVSGAPSLDNMASVTLLSAGELESRHQISLARPPLLVTFHPVTLEYEQAEDQIAELLSALEQFDAPMIFTLPNADTGGRVVSQRIKEFVRRHERAWIVDNLGMQAYFSLMKLSLAMIGNSSSGIIEAPSFGLPVVNVGTRQAGRVRAANVIDAECERLALLEALRLATSPSFRLELSGKANPYGTGDAATRIVERLRSVPIDDRLLRKRFHDLPSAHVPGVGHHA
jgi:UDP-hydrolysing UDP-N-acetyl-D-glucosamine 2-epimerase